MPARLGPYQLVDRIGEGGMGVVFLARDASQQTVALKVLRSSVAGEPTARRRLAREVETMRRVRSPYVADVLDADLAGDVPYIVTRYVPGRTLEQVVIDAGPLTGPALWQLACGLADALVAVHAAGVVHRDLKPSNVMILNGLPVVIDFGIAQGPDATQLTMTGMFMGTPGYLAPEVIEGSPSSQASDVHAWGATVAFAATGQPPFGTGSYEAIFYRIVNGQPDLDGVPAPMLPLLAGALARDPAHRPPAAALSAQAAVLDPGLLTRGAVSGDGAGADAPVTAAEATRADAAAGALVGPGGTAQLGVLPPATPGVGELPGIPPAVPALPPAGVPGVPDVPLADVALAGVPPEVPMVGVRGAAPGPAGPPAHGPPAGWGTAAAAGLGAPSSGLVPPGVPPGRGGQPAPDDFADVLPPVEYQPKPSPRRGATRNQPAAGTPFAVAGPTPGDGGPAASARWPSAMALAAMVTAAGVSVILPVMGTLAAMTLILVLRASELAQQRARQRRAAHGARPSDPFVVAAFFPWHLVRSMLASLLLAPFALAASVIAGGITIVVEPSHQLPRAVAIAAGVLVAFYGLGPGSARSRRQLQGIFAVVVRRRISQAVALVGITALALATLAAALSWTSLYWPTGPPGGFWHFGAGHVPRPSHLGWAGRLLVSHLRGW